MRSRIYKALRSATGINTPEAIRNRAALSLEQYHADNDLLVMDGIITPSHELPILDADIEKIAWEELSRSYVAQGHNALVRLALDKKEKAALLITNLRACHDGRIKTEGVASLLASFAAEPPFVAEMVDQVLSSSEVESLLQELSAGLQISNGCDVPSFALRARQILHGNSYSIKRAAAWALRANGDEVSAPEIGLIRDYCGVPDDNVKAGALHAITYVGKYEHVRTELLDAVLSVETDGSCYIGAELAHAFDPCGVPVSLLRRQQVDLLLAKFISVKDWETHQG